MKLKKGKGAFLVKVHSTDEHLCTCDHAIIEFSNDTLSKMLMMFFTLMNLKINSISDIYEITQFNYTPDFLSVCEYDDYESISEDLIDQMEHFTTNEEDGGEISVVSIESVGGIPEDVHLIRQDATTMHVKENGVIFSTYIKHTSTKLDTETISWEDLADYFEFTEEDHGQSHKEGWGLIESSGSLDGTPQIQAIDEQDVFQDDPEAWNFVKQADTMLKRKALFQVFLQNKEEFVRIMKS